MNGQPAFFERVRKHASEMWDQLEQNPELAGPWHLLFKQVQSPRHVLSELLQNADDVGATDALVRIENGKFIFIHDGEDFTEDHFASLCRFAYSNKRDMHTIGFRGIGFKSTFSIGDVVELYTPTLSIKFNSKRFTEPIWVNKSFVTNGKTLIAVSISDKHREKEIEKNLEEWLQSPISLLFFKHIRHLQIGKKDLYWQSRGNGPVNGTEMMSLRSDPEKLYLVARSDPEPFPLESLEEIKQERLIGMQQDIDFPPCRIEIVLGSKGRLYVVLPTGVETELPFACNAPFIQDPARIKIKDPETSPTNRWLLERIGYLAASVMLEWLNSSENIEKKSDAYNLFLDADRYDNSLEGVCGANMAISFASAIEGKQFLLTDAGELKKSGQCVTIPDEIYDVWPSEQISAMFDESKRFTLLRFISKSNKEKLTNQDAVEKIDKDYIIEVLQKKHLPRPKHWRSLLALWSYISPEVTAYRPRIEIRKLHIIPVQGKDVLYSAGEVVRIGEKKLLQSDEDWNFLSEYLLVVNQNWPRFLAEQRREAEESKDKKLQNEIDAAYAVLKAIGLEETSDVSTMIERVASTFFERAPLERQNCIRLAQIACKMNATTGGSFCFISRDQSPRNINYIILFDEDGSLASILPENWCSKHFLHQDYIRSFDSCSAEEWKQWIQSGRAGIHTFPPLIKKTILIWSEQTLKRELEKRYFKGNLYNRYVTNNFEIEDWDFNDDHWNLWKIIYEDEENCWGHLVERIIKQPSTYWSKATNASINQVATTGNTRSISSDPLLPNWIIKLRELPCLPDTRGFYHKPLDLLLRTSETESLMDIEPFVHKSYDTEAIRPLLTLLGVSDKPTGPDGLIERLRALAKADKPPIHEVEKWYRRLDQMVNNCSTDDFEKIKSAFYEEDIILTENSGWSNANSVFLTSSEDDVPCAAVIKLSCNDLSIWRRISIPERPTIDLAIEWLNSLPSGQSLSPDDLRRVKALLPRHSDRIWNDCDHWINLAGEWVSIEQLTYALTMQTLVPWKHLHEWVKQKTADFQSLSIEITAANPFCNIPPLVDHIEDRLQNTAKISGTIESKPWLNLIGNELRRIELDNKEETERIRALADDLAQTYWHTTSQLEILPYIDGKPAGISRRVDVLWLNKMLYVNRLPNAKVARLVPEILGRAFGRTDITAALNYCFGRKSEDISEYLEENFKLVSPDNVVLPNANNTEEEKVKKQDIDETDIKVPDSKEEESTTKEELITEPAESMKTLEEDNDTDDAVINNIDNEQKVHHPSKPKPSLIELYAKIIGFHKDGDNSFFHEDGRRIAKTIDNLFPWEMRNSGGQIIRYYWLKDHCLEKQPLQIEFAIWAAVENAPQFHTLILVNESGDPVEKTGEHLQEMRDQRKIVLYPATYRLVYENNK